jgi:predicted MFS family arabinose efflux permease
MPIIVVLWLAFFLVTFNIAMMIPLLPFIERDIGLSAGEAGLVLAAFPVVALLSNLALGPFIDRFGRKRFIMLGAAACGLLFLATAASRSAPLIVACRAATGLFMPMIGASVFAAIADCFPPEARTRVAGYITTAAPLSFLASMSIGMLLGGLVAWQAPLILLAVVALGVAVAVSLVLPATEQAALSNAPIAAATYRDRLLTLSLDANSRLLLLSYFAFAAGIFVFLGFYPTWAVQDGLAGYGAEGIGVMLLLGEVGGLAGALASGRLVRRFGRPFGVCAGAGFGTALILLAIPPGAGIAVVQTIAYGLFAFGRDLMLALFLGGAMQLVAASQRGSLNAILNAIYQTGATIGGLLSAWLYAWQSGFVANAVLASALFAGAGAMLARIAPPPATP